MSDHILFAGPWARGKGERSSRMVLHAATHSCEVREYIVHMQYKDEKGHLHYDNGDYLRDFDRALDKFAERSKRHYQGRKFNLPKNSLTG